MRLGNPLLYSLLFNGILAGDLAFHALSRGTTKQPLMPVPVSAAPSPSPAPPSQPFLWSSLESEDYPTYIANLRKIGCPEKTLRDIISADLENLYSTKRAALFAKTPDASASRQALESLRQEKCALLNQLLGTPSTPINGIAQEATGSSTASLPVISSTTASPESATDTTGYPLIFQPISSAELTLTEAQAALLERLRKAFIQEIGGPNQAPSDPHYLERWEQATQIADQRIRTLLGQQFYRSYEKAVSRQKANASSL
jgi:hypothetical protein